MPLYNECWCAWIAAVLLMQAPTHVLDVAQYLCWRNCVSCYWLRIMQTSCVLPTLCVTSMVLCSVWHMLAALGFVPSVLVSILSVCILFVWLTAVLLEINCVCRYAEQLHAACVTLMNLAWLCSLMQLSSVATTWLILPVVICLSQRLSHACLSISFYTVKLRIAH